MAEESEGQDTVAEASASGFDPAVALALGGASREEADAFLKKQSVLLDEQVILTRIQAKELAHELKLRHWSLQVRHVSALLKLAFEVSLALIAIALACFIGATVWSAAHADGLIIDAFSVPNDLAAQGLTGEVVASRMLDRLTEMQNETGSTRAPQSYANDWGNDIKVEIPDTGVSFGEAYRYLKGWLGHETHFGGEAVRTDTGLALTTRISGDSSASFAGTELDALVEKGAEYVYGNTQPYRYAQYLYEHGRMDEALALYQHLATAGPVEERPWGYIGWSNWLIDSDFITHIRLLERALALQPDNALTLTDLTDSEGDFSHPERALGYCKELQSVLDRGGQRLVSAHGISSFRRESGGQLALLTGDFQTVARDTKDTIAAGFTNPILSQSYGLARAQTNMHDPSAARGAIADPAPGGAPGLNALDGIRTRMLINIEIQDWNGVLSDANAVELLLLKYPGLHLDLPTLILPLTAYAEARLGKVADAEKSISVTPADCYDCLISRARIAEVEGQQARADWWFDRSVNDALSIPFAYADWGQALLDRGDPEGAIAKFTIANQKGPKFADPLEGWGEALMKKNRSDLALAKFEEAEKYAPNWGRLHMKWGEALGYAGRKDDAQKQYALAAGLDLSTDDKAELAKVSHG